jgi:hypothetical protein
MISGGNIAALTQVRMRADLTTFVGSLRRAQELVERVRLTGSSCANQWVLEQSANLYDRG